MAHTGTISLDELLDIKSSDKQESRNFTYVGLECAPPPASAVEEFRSSDWYLSSSSSLISSNSKCSSRYDLNWANPSDYLSNWRLLSSHEKEQFRSLVVSDTGGNSNRFGLKKLNLESHLLLSIGCDMMNIALTGKDPILTNLKNSHTKDYHQEIFDNRTVDPRSSLRAYKKFIKTYSPETLFSLGLECYQAVVTLDKKYSKLTDPQETKELYQKFFQENNRAFSRLCNKRKKIFSYLYSHEISVDSIINQEYRAHTHIVFWVPRAAKGKRAASDVKEIENIFNSSFKDRELKIETIESDKGDVPRVSRTYKDIEVFLAYMFRGYSLAPQYLREIREDNIRELNKKTVETYHNLIWLVKGDVFSKSVRRNNHSYIPKRDQKESFKHPLLQTKKISNTIKVKIPRNSKGTAHALLVNQPCQSDKPKRSRKISSKTQLAQVSQERGVSRRSKPRAGAGQEKLSGERSTLSKLPAEQAERAQQEKLREARRARNSRDHQISGSVQQILSRREQKRMERNSGRAQKRGSQPELHRGNAKRGSRLRRSEDLPNAQRTIQKICKKVSSSLLPASSGPSIGSST